MFSHFQIIAILFICLALDVQAFNISNSALEPNRSLGADLSEPLTNFINATELVILQNSVPREQVEWINATLDDPWSSRNMQSQKDNRRVRNIANKHSRRYIDVNKCFNLHRRVVLRNELHAVSQMVLDAQRSLTLDHPIWRALIAGAFQEEPRALDRMKNLFKVLYDTINDPNYTVVLSCNVATPQCLQTRKAPGDGRQQVPAGYFNIDDNVVNLCNGFFGMPQLRHMECKEGTPMSYYDSTGKDLSAMSDYTHISCNPKKVEKVLTDAQATSLLHELTHAIFEPLSKTKYPLHIRLPDFVSPKVTVIRLTLNDSYDFLTFDLAYGFGACAELAQGTCGRGEGGLRCSPLATIANLDTIVWLVNGYYWYNQCFREGKTIPLF